MDIMTLLSIVLTFSRLYVIFTYSRMVKVKGEALSSHGFVLVAFCSSDTRLNRILVDFRNNSIVQHSLPFCIDSLDFRNIEGSKRSNTVQFERMTKQEYTAQPNTPSQ